MRKIILSNKIEIELSNKGISENSENSIFSDSFFAKQTYPFDLIITDEIDIAFNLITDYNTEKNVILDAIYVHNNIMEKATFEIIEIIGTKASCIIKYGFDEYPSWEKKLSELSLDKFDVPNIYTHANTVVNQTYPAVNYNFPMVHTNKYVDDDRLTNFENIINKRINGQFIENTYDHLNFIAYDKNIIQPLPYLLHILKRGFFDGGYILDGEILQDGLIQQMTIYGCGDYFKYNKSDELLPMIILQSEYINVLPIPDSSSLQYYFEKTITIPKAGVYKITGSAYAQAPGNGRGWWLNGIPFNIAATSNYDPTYVEFFTIYDTFIIINQDNSILKYKSNSVGLTQSDDDILNVNFQLITLYNGINFNPIIENENKIDLTKAVPDMTFGEFVLFVKNYLNYDITKIDNGKIYMNKVLSYLNYNNSKDLSAHQIKKPSRKFEQGNSFLLQFRELNSTEYSYEKVFQDINGVVTQNYTVDKEKTKTIDINGLPLPNAEKSGINTAYSFENDDSKPYVVGYTGLISNQNIALNYTPYLLPNIHPIYWYEWFKFRLKAQIFRWLFYKDDIELQDIFIKDIVHAYTNYHLIKTIDKTELKPGVYSYEIETYS